MEFAIIFAALTGYEAIGMLIASRIEFEQAFYQEVRQHLRQHHPDAAILTTDRAIAIAFQVFFALLWLPYFLHWGFLVLSRRATAKLDCQGKAVSLKLKRRG